MQGNNEELFRAFIDSDQFKWYIEQLKEVANDYRDLADQIDLTDSQKLWYLGKAQMVEEIIKLPIQWLKS